MVNLLFLGGSSRFFVSENFCVYGNFFDLRNTLPVTGTCFVPQTSLLVTGYRGVYKWEKLEVGGRLMVTFI